MVRRAYMVVGIAAAAVLMTLVVASTSTGSVLGPQRHAGPATDQPFKRVTPPSRLGAQQWALPHWMLTAFTVLLVLYALGLVALAIFSRLAQRLDEEEELDLGADGDPEASDWGAVISAELAATATEQLSGLTRGSPRNAIVACWMRLQDATRSAGVPAEESETSLEFTVRALRRLDLDPAAITTLSELYREARFSDHAMTEQQRTEAVGALVVLAGQLTVAHRHRPSPDAVLDGVPR